MNTPTTQDTPYFALILSGGEARRMQCSEKGLVSFKGKAMINWVLDANNHARTISISCNRQLSDYQLLLNSYQLEMNKVHERSLLENAEIADLLKKLPSCIKDRKFADKSGPVAGILSYFLCWQEVIEALEQTNSKSPDEQNPLIQSLLKTPVVVSSCDMVLLDQSIIQFLVNSWTKTGKRCLYASSNQQLCYLPFVVELGAAINLAIKWMESSSDYSARQFSIKQWLAELKAQVVVIDNHDWLNRFQSINTLDQLKALEAIK